jgi:hypothetical protein
VGMCGRRESQRGGWLGGSEKGGEGGASTVKCSLPRLLFPLVVVSPLFSHLPTLPCCPPTSPPPPASSPSHLSILPPRPRRRLAPCWHPTAAAAAAAASRGGFLPLRERGAGHGLGSRRRRPSHDGAELARATRQRQQARPQEAACHQGRLWGGGARCHGGREGKQQDLHGCGVGGQFHLHYLSHTRSTPPSPPVYLSHLPLLSLSSRA